MRKKEPRQHVHPADTHPAHLNNAIFDRRCQRQPAGVLAIAGRVANVTVALCDGGHTALHRDAQLKGAPNLPGCNWLLVSWQPAVLLSFGSVAQERGDQVWLPLGWFGGPCCCWP